MRIVAIDPGYDRVGVAIIEGERGKENIIFSDCIVTDRKFDIYKRMYVIGESVDKIIKKYTPEILVLEYLFFSKNTKTAMRVSETRGIIIFLAKKYNINIYEITPNEIKVALSGNGRATKNDIEFSLRKFFGIDTTGKLDDELDAIATGLAYFSLSYTIQ